MLILDKSLMQVVPMSSVQPLHRSPIRLMRMIHSLRHYAIFAVLGGLASSASAGDLRVGKAVVDITPEVGSPMLTPKVRPSVKLAEPAHDPLCVRAIVLENGGARRRSPLRPHEHPNWMFEQAKSRFTPQRESIRGRS